MKRIIDEFMFYLNFGIFLSRMNDKKKKRIFATHTFYVGLLILAILDFFASLSELSKLYPILLVQTGQFFFYILNLYQFNFQSISRLVNYSSMQI